MKPANKTDNAQDQGLQNPRHSSVLLWAVLMMVILSGLLYLGSKVKEQRTETPQVAVNTRSNISRQDLPASASHPEQSVLLTVGDILATLKSQHLINPYVYKTRIILKKEATSDLTQDHDALWQSGEQQLTVVNATVRAGVDLSELTESNLKTKAPITLHLPFARMMIQIDNVTMYDVKTGQPSTVQMGLSLTSDQEKMIRAQVEREFCQSEVLQTATEETRQHVIALLDSMKVSMVVRVAEPVGCQQSAS